MKIIGGSFGVKGSVNFDRDNQFVIKGARQAIYSRDQVESVTASQSKEKKFGVLGFIFVAIVLSIVLGLFLNIFGVVIAIIIAIFGSFYTETTNHVEVRFNDAKTVVLECSSGKVKDLVAYAPS